jgi:SAM-dependent methyltransferase
MSWLRIFRRRKPEPDAQAWGEAIASDDGRQYVSGAPYLLPKDLGETNRLDFQHYMLRYALRGNYAAPLDNPRSILDVGAGTGRWAMDLALQFPNSRVFGMDLRPPAVDRESTPAPRPTNYTFVPGNILEQAPFPDDSFDFVHQRFLTLAIPAAKWPGVVTELLRITRRGGWVELVETTTPLGAPAIDQMARWGVELTKRSGIDMSLMAHIGELLGNVGAINVTARTINMQVGRPAGRIGAMSAVDYLTALTAVRGHMAKLGIADENTFDAMMARARYEFDRGVYIQPVFLAFGQKA